MGVTIRTIVADNVATRCDGCRELIEGTPWRINVLDIVATERPADWSDSPTINPGPFQFHSDEACVHTLDEPTRQPLLPQGPRPRDHATGRDPGTGAAVGPVRRLPPR